MRLEGKVAIVTGGASGIGAATASLFARECARVAIFDVNANAATDGALPIACDVTHEDEVRQAVEQVASAFGPISIVVNNAGCAFRNGVADQDVEGWDRVLAVNLKGAYLVSKHALAHLLRLGRCELVLRAVVRSSSNLNWIEHSVSQAIDQRGHNGNGMAVCRRSQVSEGI